MVDKESLKKAQIKYRQNNKDKINAQRRKHYNDKKNDEAFMAKKREQAKKYYQSKKAINKEG